MEQFLAFARDVEAITAEETEALNDEIAAGLDEAAAAQVATQRNLDPVARFEALLAGALTAGRAHVASKSGNTPLKGGAWGWRAGEPSGDRIGWVDGHDLFLDREAAYRVFATIARDTNEPLLKPDTLWTRLHERGLLVSTDLKTKRQTLAVRKMLDGARRQVLHLRSSIVLGEHGASAAEGDGDDE